MQLTNFIKFIIIMKARVIPIYKPTGLKNIYFKPLNLNFYF
jgi:hypothetical protein